MTLAATQRAMRDWLTAGEAAGFGTAAAPGLAVYRNNHRAALVACLEAGFPRTRAWIGDDAFLDAVIHHIGRIPPSSWTSNRLPPGSFSWLSMPNCNALRSDRTFCGFAAVPLA